MIKHPRGPFAAGDQVQLTDPKGRQHRLVLVAGKSFHTHRGALAHDDLIGQPEGSLVTSAGGTPYVAFRPLLADYALAMDRGAAVVYPKDAAQIIGLADIFPGARVVEAGAGFGALSCWLLRAIGETGQLTSFERRPDFAAIALANVERYFGGPHPAWQLVIGDLAAAGLADRDRVVLDMLAPWEHVSASAAMLVPGGLLCCYVATTTQLARTVTVMREQGNLRRAGRMGDTPARLACRRACSKARASYGGAHGLPDHREATGRRSDGAAAAPSAVQGRRGGRSPRSRRSPGGRGPGSSATAGSSASSGSRSRRSGRDRRHRALNETVQATSFPDRNAECRLEACRLVTD